MARFIAVFALILLIPIASSAQNITTLSVNSGLGIPDGPDLFSNYWSPSFNLGGGLSVYLNNKLAIQGYIDYNTFSLDGDNFLIDFGLGGYGLTLTGGNVHILQVSSNLKFNIIEIEQSISPYLITGIGYYNIGASDITLELGGQKESEPIDVEDNGLSFNFGAGIDFKVSDSIIIFIDGRYLLCIAKDDNTTLIPIRVGVSFTL